MAEATLNDVIARLRLDNEKQLREQSATTDAISSLSGRLTALLVFLELQDLKNKELLSELQRDRTSTSASATATAPAGPSFELPGPLLFLGRTLGSIAAFAAGLTLATEGLGPAGRDLSRFFRAIRNVFTLPARLLDDLRVRAFGGQTFGAYISTQFRNVASLFRGFEFDPSSGRYRNLTTGRFTRPNALQRTLDSFNRFAGRIKPFLDLLTNNAIVRGVFRFLRPIAAIFSVFDGFENAAEEMEDREGFFNRYLGGGLGGFVSGFFGSFFGEFFNFIKWALMWPIKKLLPEEWLIENPDGSMSINRDANLFTNILGGFEDFDFNRLITNLVQIPFDALGNAFDFITGFFTEDGTSQEQLNAYWEERGLFGAATDVIGWVTNLVFAPINAVLREIETAFFGADPNREQETFTQRIARYTEQLYEWFASIIPSMDEIKTKLAQTLGPGRITDFLGLADYLPMTTDDAERRLGNLFEEINDSFADINRFSSQLEGLDPNSLAYGDVASQLEAARRELEQDRAEAAAVLARAGTSGVSQQVINNYQQQYESFMFPNSGAVDGSDPLRQ